ncbi:hypothetical protein M433DRAFT_358639 [Acidomyces richmondensis BFW]|nr:MAG: hypothetical protein FE78DRAFT_267056 [Acidomyces sp. 'richmondensis']KYG43393.1 hypothetical protein M433DRAFT_358639 [Acidomyces richmondensis BFW]
MTEILSASVHSLLGSPKQYQMAGSANQNWQQHQQHQHQQHQHQQNSYLDHLPLLTRQWGDRRPLLGGMQDVDLPMFHHNNVPYTTQAYQDSSGGLIPSGAGYQGDGSWASASDVDMNSPTVPVFQQDVTEGYFPSTHLSLPTTNRAGSASTPSPRSSNTEASPQIAEDFALTTVKPPLSRSTTAPETRQRRATASYPNGVIKRFGTSDDGDEDYVPGEDVKNRGRKRQRIPHTAVERRYRENLNAHLEKLRQAVPSLASRSGPGNRSGDGNAEGVKPSKCEVLSGAIEHISALDKENQALRSENQVMRARIEEMERRYRGNPHGGSFPV